MPKFGKFPPWSSKKEEQKPEEEHEFVPTEAPEALPEGLATASEEEIVNEVNAYYDAWSKRLQDHNVFAFGTSGSPLRKLNENRNQAIRLAQSVFAAGRESPQDKIFNEGPGTIFTRINEPVEAADAENRRASIIEEIGVLLKEMNASAVPLEKLVKENDDRLALNEATPKESVEMNSAAVREIQALKLAERAGISEERAAAAAALEARKPLLKEFLKAQTAFKKLKKPTAEQSEEFEKAKAAYDAINKQSIAEQLAYADKLQTSSKERIESKKNKKNLTPEKSAQLLERYNRLIRVKEIVIPGKNQEIQVRKELLDEKGRNIFQKALKLNQDINTFAQTGAENLILKTEWGQRMDRSTVQRIARITSRSARLLGFATVGAVGGTAASMLFGGPAAAALIAAAGGRVALGAVNMATGTLAGYGLGKGFEKTKGKKLVEAFASMQTKDIVSEADLEEQGSAAVSGSAEAIQAQRMKIENVGAMLTSLGFSASMVLEAGGIEAIKNAAERVWNVLHGQNLTSVEAAGISVHSNVSGPDEPPYIIEPAMPHRPFTYPNELQGFGPTTHADAIHPIGQEYFAQHSNGIPTEAAATSPVSGHVESLAVGAQVGKVHINTADKLLGHFRAQLEKDYPDVNKAPAAVQSFLKAAKDGTGLGHENDMTRLFGFQDEHGASAMIHPGDTVRVENGALIFHNAAGEHTLVDAQGTPHHANLGEMHQTGAPEVSHPVAETHQPAPEAAQPDHVAPEAPAPIEHHAAPEPVHAEAPSHGVPHDILQRPLPEYNPVDYPHTPLGGGSAPVEHAVPAPDVPVQEVVVHAQTIMVNGHPLDLRTPHIVESSVGKGSHILIGGTPDERFAFTEKYFSKPQNNGAELYVESTERNLNPDTGKPYIDRFFIGKDGELVREPHLQSKYGGFLGLFAKTDYDTVPDPKTFTKVIE